jgi:hypothetical protein
MAKICDNCGRVNCICKEKVKITIENYWKAFHVYNDAITDVEEILIRKAFETYIKGNSCFDEMAAPELMSFYDTFKGGWITASILGGN